MKSSIASSSYGQKLPPVPTAAPTASQTQTARRSDRSLRPMKGYADSIEIHVKGDLRRIRDGALAALQGHISIDRFGTARNWIGAPINPDAGGITGNVINNAWLSPEGSAWIGATGTIARNQADRDWDALGALGQITELMHGRIMYAHDGTAWEVVVTGCETHMMLVNSCRSE